MHGHGHTEKKYIPRLVAWETTRRCPLNCRHCRASAMDKKYAGELTTEESFRLLDNIASFSKPIIILTGGEPMARQDIYEIAKYGTSLGLRMVMAPCGIFMNEQNVQQMIDAGIKRISLSIDGHDKETHDAFRQVDGAFDSVMNAARLAREGGLEFQVNTTVTKLNYKNLDKILALAMNIGAVSFHPFLLVPTGRGKNMAEFEIDPREYEDVLTWVYEKSLDLPIQMKPTCAPHYYRILRQKEKAAGRQVTVESHGMNAMTKGCLGGQGFSFISHTGKVQICGFLEEEAGDIRKTDMNFQEIWENSELFLKMRNPGKYEGKCGYCEYLRVCGGCRARAFSATENMMSEEPYCVYEPANRAGAPE
ncbi:MAG: radical SAM protein [Spirochaetaceae bacterium]|jgi:heme b synthase|nr:radical SAM protein [Spirochaetaceae bacterium]